MVALCHFTDGSASGGLGVGGVWRRVGVASGGLGFGWAWLVMFTTLQKGSELGVVWSWLRWGLASFGLGFGRFLTVPAIPCPGPL